MDTKTIVWIKQILANDEASSDEELLEHFVKEGGLSRDEASPMGCITLRVSAEYVLHY